MTLGAIHFLKSMDCIEMQVSIGDFDVPILRGIIGTELISMYSHITDIASAMDGKRSVAEISEATAIDKNVLITVLSSLYKRGIITFKE